LPYGNEFSKELFTKHYLQNTSFLMKALDRHSFLKLSVLSKTTHLTSHRAMPVAS